jgi:hypothetical protein
MIASAVVAHLEQSQATSTSKSSHTPKSFSHSAWGKGLSSLVLTECERLEANVSAILSGTSYEASSGGCPSGCGVSVSPASLTTTQET